MPYGMIPAGAVQQNRVAVYVTMKSKVDLTRGVELKSTSSRSVLRFECPDRTLHVATSDGGKPDKDLKCPIREDSFDYVVFLDPYSRVSAHRRYVDKVLVSAMSAVKAEFFARDYVPDGVQIFGDSGGAQMKLGTHQYVNPFMVIDWMNQMADEGACLDIAPRLADTDDKKTIRRTADTQVRNNKVFLRQRRRDLKLLNVVHGFNLAQLRRWMSVVYDSQFDGMAAGCDNDTSPAACMRNILVPALEAEDEHLKKRLHLFAVSGGATLPASVWLGKLLDKRHGGVEFTTDSASWLYGCQHGMYARFDETGVLQWRNLVKEPSDFAVGSQLPCACEVCSAVRWTDVFRGGQYGPTLLLSYHNLFALKNYESFWANIANRSKNVAEYVDYAASVGFAKMSAVVGTIRYVDFAFKHGLDEAERKFSALLTEPRPEAQKKLEAMFSWGGDVAQKKTPEKGAEKSESKKKGKSRGKGGTTIVPSQVRHADSIKPILDNFDNAGIEKFINYTHSAPNRHAVYTGYLLTERAATAEKNKKKKIEKGAVSRDSG